MLLLLLACHSNPTPDDSHRPGDTAADDTGAPDSGDDTGTDDSGDDTGADDTGADDSGDDTAPPDTGPDDSSDDTAPPDTGSDDTATDDTATDDTAILDTGPFDTGDTGEPIDPRIGMYVPDFTLPDLNPNSLRYEEPISPRDYLQQVSGWYFIHST